ncbi:TIM barrel protein [Candidatus Woesearchaeota archaeon]|jgi:sugar phosphate isomerase/epimerase|nr:TIM barrel protein [Candidatus Woesearchaeota archaeon]MBT5272894.1 TIM barrel protein [Candidatus Woesearchaeota archaeon]MBT6041360.1 TIM barrel protein [Candidatus Woesearchaeota archaeon]MBT6337243.1 TIM barrel protein [Candidatus Woesearchaeota archaeon]MBT7927120.1 TIM barrel protein [Candidatus Woesearchaeota archaeon]
MEFGSGYSFLGPDAQDYSGGAYVTTFGGYGEGPGGSEANIEAPIVKASDIGMSVPEGSRFGSLLKTTTDAIRRGAGWVELSTNMGGGAEATGAEAYGKEAREALRDLARANSVKFTSVHTPTNIGNMSGYNPQERGFNDEHRKIEIEEVKKAVEFAADVGARNIVVHTGEFQRDMTAQDWNKQREDGTWEFMSYNEEPGRAVLYMVDDRTGKLITEVRKSQIVHEPKFMTVVDKDGRERYTDADGRILDETSPKDLFNRVPIWNHEETKFDTNRLTWDDFVDRANDWNENNINKEPWRKGRKYSPEEMFFRSQMETRILQARGSSLFHGRFYEDEKRQFEQIKEAYEFFKKVEKDMPIEEQWKLLKDHNTVSGRYAGGQFVPSDKKMPTEILADDLHQLKMSLMFTRESSAASDANADETYETLLHVVPVEAYAKDQTSTSYAEAGIHAMEMTKKSQYAHDPIAIAPENIFPEMGYGSHPEELIGLVQDARKRMVEFLTEKTIEDPGRRRDRKGNLLTVSNPHYTGIAKTEAEKLAKSHIRATIDTQHLGMWWKHFTPNPGETRAERKKRFDGWYMDEVKKMQDADIIGHLHVVDGLGGGHHHLPVGQGDLPVKTAVEYLKKKGFEGTMISEGHGEEALFGQGRILTETWRAFGSPIGRTGWGVGAPGRWADVQHSYFRQMQSPYFIFGAYSPSNDWQLWSQVPME